MSSTTSRASGRTPERTRRLGFLLLLVPATAMVLVIVIMFSWSRALWVEELSVRQAAPTPGRWIRAHDVELYVQEFGDAAAAPLVVTHGTGAWSGTWESNVAAMAQAGYRVIAVDLPPFGFSTRPASRDYSRHEQALRILGLVDALAAGPVTLLGHSYGGGPAAEAAMLQPDRVRHLILLDAAIGLTDQPIATPQEGWVHKLLGLSALRTALIATVGTQPLFGEFWLRKFVARKEAVTESRTAIYLKPFVVKGFTASLGDWAYQFASEHGVALSERPQGFRKLQMPLTLIWGEEDTITPLSQARTLGSLVAGARLVVLAGVGHIPQIEDVKLFNQRVAEVLAGNRAAGPR